MKEASAGQARLLVERAVRGDARPGSRNRPARSVTVNEAESPLGWLFARGHVSQRQYDAGERLRSDWDRGQMGQRVTMSWDASPARAGKLVLRFALDRVADYYRLR